MSNAALARYGAESLNVPGLRRGRVRDEQMNMVHLDGVADRGILQNLDADVIGRGQERLLGIRSRLHGEAVRLPFGDGRVEVLHVKPEVIDHRPNRAACRILLPQNDIDPRELHHLELFIVHRRAAHLGPETLVRIDILHIEVNVPNGVAGGVGRNQLCMQGSRAESGANEEDPKSHLW